MDELIQLLEEVREDIDFETEDSLVDGGILDSFDILQIISAIQENYDVTIPAGAIIPENFNNADALYKLVQQLVDESL